MKTILSIDGGGVRGIIPATLLQEIEKRTRKPISESFDMICGVSTGGIIAVALTVPNKSGKSKYSAEDIVKFYVNHSGDIFSSGLSIPFFQILKSKYSTNKLKETIQTQVGSTEFKQLNNKVMVPSYDLIERRPFFFKNWKPSVLGIAAYEVATATACAPTYFDPYPLSTSNGAEQKVLIDGSVCTNNPAMCAYSEAKRLWGDEEIFVVSLGTGDISDPLKFKNQKNWGMYPWFTNDIVEIMIDAPTNTVDYQLRTVIPDSYIRIHNKIQFASENIDDASSSNIRRLVQEAKGLVVTEDFRIERIVAAIEKRAREIEKLVLANKPQEV